MTTAADEITASEESLERAEVDERHYVRSRELEHRAKLSLFGLTLGPEMTGFGAPLLLVSFQLYFWLLIEHMRLLWHRSPDRKRDLEVVAAYPWTPLFAGYKGKAALFITLVLLPIVGSGWLFLRWAMMVGRGPVWYPIPLLLTALAIIGSLLIAGMIYRLRVEIANEAMQT